MKTSRRIRELLGIDLPIIQAPMSGYNDAEMAIAVSEAGGLGSLPCARLMPEQLSSAMERIRSRTERPVNLNFFCHKEAAPDPQRSAAWREQLQGYYAELGIDAEAGSPSGAARTPFGAAMCDVLVELKPRIVSFHFGLPPEPLLARVKATGATILSSATTVEEARWLETHGADAIIAQGAEAGGHRGMFLTDDPARQVGTFALVPQIVDAVAVPVIAAGGIGDGRGIVAALALGAEAVQIGSAYLRCAESLLTPIHRRALETVRDDSTALTNVLTGRPARGIVTRFVREVGPINQHAPAFPTAADAVTPLKTAAEARGSDEFSQLWAGQAAALARDISAGEFTRRLGAEALARLGELTRDYGQLD